MNNTIDLFKSNTQSMVNVIKRSEHTKILDGKIETLGNLNVNLKSLNSNSQELNQIVNNKSSNLALNNEINLKNFNNKNDLALTTLLLNEKENKIAPANTIQNNLTNKANYFSIGNKQMKINSLKNLIQNFNSSVSNTKNNSSKNSINTLRHYLNLLTKFDSKLANTNYNLFSFNKTNNYLFAMQKAAKFLHLSFNSKGCLISKPSFNLVYTNASILNEINHNAIQNINTPKVIINLFYYVKTTEFINNSITLNDNAKILTDQFESKFSNLSDYLTKLFNNEVELNLVRLYKPYQEANILVQFLNGESYNNKFIKLISNLFKNINIKDSNKSDFILDSNLIQNESNNHYSYPSNISGVNVKLAGRALNERIIPRLTVKREQRGSFNRLNAKLIEKSMFTDKTRKGAYTFTVTLSHNFK